LAGEKIYSYSLPRKAWFGALPSNLFEKLCAGLNNNPKLHWRSV
jgi:hypothetical protein